MPIVNDTPPTDSIRVYLKEIGSIKLLKGNEEIELARSIADLLHLESIRNALQERLNRLPSDREWANELNMDVPQFRRRLYLGRRAKNKMVEAIASSISRERSAAASSSPIPSRDRQNENCCI